MDRSDYEILAALQKNARLSNQALAEKIGLAPSTTLERTRRLTWSGVIRGCHADLDPAAVGVGVEAMLAIRLRRHSRAEVEAFLDYVLTVPEVVATWHVTGPVDYLVHVAVRDTEHLRALALSAFTERPEVDHIETSLIFQSNRRPGIPIYPPRAEED